MNIEAAEQQNRVRIYRIQEQEILMFAIDDPRSLPEAFAIGRRPDIPYGAKILRVHHDFASRSFDFLVCHPSFDCVRISEMPPIHPDWITMIGINAIREADGRYRIEDAAKLFPAETP